MGPSLDWKGLRADYIAMADRYTWYDDSNKHQMRILLQHPYVNIKYLTADRSAGMSFAEVYPQFSYVKVGSWLGDSLV